MVVFRSDFFHLATSEAYDYTGACADLRSGNLMHILEGTITIEDYITCELPIGLRYGRFQYWLGTRGGIVFLADSQTENDFDSGLLATYDNGSLLHGGIEIRANGELEQYAEMVYSYEPLVMSDLIVRREKVWMREDGYLWYVACISKENSVIEYCIYLNADLYSEEAFFNITETLEMEPHAIY